MGLGLPDFGPVQNNISYNATKGVTRGIHAERGTSTSASLPARSSAHGLTCARARASARCSPPVWTRAAQSTCLAAWATASRHCRTHGVHVSGERALVARAEEDLHVREPCGSGTEHPVADSAGGVRALRGRSAPPDAQGRQAHGSQAHPGDGLQRPAGPRDSRLRGSAWSGGLRVHGHRRVRLLRPEGIRGIRLEPVRHDHQRRCLHGRRQGRDRRRRPIAWKANAQVRLCWPRWPRTTTSPSCT